MKKENFLKKTLLKPGIIQKETKGKLFKRKNGFNLLVLDDKYFFRCSYQKKNNKSHFYQ